MSDNIGHFVKVGTTALRIGRRVIHFYYSPEERKRFVPFLIDGLAAREAVVFACRHDDARELREELQVLRFEPEKRYLQVMITDHPHATAQSIGSAVRHLLARNRRARVVADFGLLGSRRALLETEAELGLELSGEDVSLVTQYDGRVVPTQSILEQFGIHDLTVVGNVLYHERADYTPAEEYWKPAVAVAV